MSDLGYRLVSFGGLFVMLGIAYALSENRRAISLRVVAWGLALQLILVLLVLYTWPGKWLFDGVEKVFGGILSFSNEGAKFLFGSLATEPSYGAFVAFQVLPIVIFVSSLSAAIRSKLAPSVTSSSRFSFRSVSSSWRLAA